MASGHPCVALVPARDFDTGKSRLAGALSGEARAGLGRWMLECVLKALKGVRGIDEIAVISDGSSVLALSDSLGAAGIRCPARDLNDDLEAGRRWALERNARMILIVPADLPALEPSDVEAMLAEGEKNNPPGGRAVLAPSPDGGTNGLLLEPPGDLPFSFGLGSFERHRAAALAEGLDFFRFENPGFSLDVDTPADLAALAEKSVPIPEWLSAITTA
jgi:2-phospho-L-lactate guanylyltransferase